MLYGKWKGYDSSFNSWIDKSNQYFSKPFRNFWGNINVKVDLSNFALKSNLASLKNGVDKLDIDRLVPVPIDLRKLSDAVKNYVVKKTW